MNLTDQTVNGTNEIHLTDSLNASLLEVKVSLGETSVIPSETDLIVYVDTSSSSSPTENRKQYLFNLNDTLKYLNGTSDEFSVKLAIENNDAFMKATVKRMIGSSEEGNIVLETPIIEELEGYPLTLFEGENYIYTNYENAVIEVIYPKDTVFNRMFLNNASYVDHKLRNDGEFCLDDIYFKDAFTKTEDKLNLEVNHASIDCLSSNDNKFSLDSDGNLIVNSVLANSINVQSIFDSIYPVGSIYMSINDTNPSILFGGVWEQLKDRFLLGAGDTYTNGTIGGEATHILTAGEMPAHIHGLSSFAKDTGNSYTYYGTWTNGAISRNKTHWTGNTQNAGLGEAHNNMPPYLTVYMWKRVL